MGWPWGSSGNVYKSGASSVLVSSCTPSLPLWCIICHYAGIFFHTIKEMTYIYRCVNNKKRCNEVPCSCSREAANIRAESKRDLSAVARLQPVAYPTSVYLLFHILLCSPWRNILSADIQMDVSVAALHAVASLPFLIIRHGNSSSPSVTLYQ